LLTDLLADILQLNLPTFGEHQTWLMSRTGSVNVLLS